jgi:APA family basic amino acid/polyamine antiporter
LEDAVRKSFFATKSVQAMRAQAAQTGLKRTLGSLDLIMLGVGVVIGAGIFVVTGRAAAINAGPAVSLSFVIAGLAAALAGLCYSEMAAMLPASGGTYSYTSAALGQGIAFLIGWDLILEYLLGAAMVSVSWSGYVTAFFRTALGITLPAAWTQAPWRWDEAADAFVRTGSYINAPACLFVAAVTSILVVGIRESSRVNIAVVAAKMVAIALFVIFGIQAIDPANWQPFLPENTGTFGEFGASGVVRGASMVFFAYVGFDAISTAAQEAKNPNRDLPRGILGSLGICVALYVVVSLVLTGVVSYKDLAVPHPIAVGIDAIGYRWLTTVVELGAIAGLTSGALVMLMGQPRIFLAMAQDGLFPKVAQRVHPKYGTPHITTIGTGVVCAVASGIAPVDVLSELVSLGTLLAFLLVSVSVTVMRLRAPQLPRPFRVPFGPYLIPLSSAAISLVLIASMPVATLQRVGMWMLLGLAFYTLYGRRHVRTLQQGVAVSVPGAPAAAAGSRSDAPHQ